MLFLLYGLAATFCLMALLVAASGDWVLGVVFLGVELAAVLLIRMIGLNAEARRLTAERLQRLDQPRGVPVEPEASNDEVPVSARARPGEAEATPE